MPAIIGEVAQLVERQQGTAVHMITTSEMYVVVGLIPSTAGQRFKSVLLHIIQIRYEERIQKDSKTQGV